MVQTCPCSRRGQAQMLSIAMSCIHTFRPARKTTRDSRTSVSALHAHTARYALFRAGESGNCFVAPINRKNCIEIFVSAAVQCDEHPTLTVIVPEVGSFQSHCRNDDGRTCLVQRTTDNSKSAYMANIDKMENDPPDWVVQTIRRRVEAQVVCARR